MRSRISLISYGILNGRPSTVLKEKLIGVSYKGESSSLRSEEALWIPDPSKQTLNANDNDFSGLR